MGRQTAVPGETGGKLVRIWYCRNRQRGCERVGGARPTRRAEKRIFSGRCSRRPHNQTEGLSTRPLPRLRRRRILDQGCATPGGEPTGADAGAERGIQTEVSWTGNAGSRLDRNSGWESDGKRSPATASGARPARARKTDSWTDRPAMSVGGFRRCPPPLRFRWNGRWVRGRTRRDGCLRGERASGDAS